MDSSAAESTTIAYLEKALRDLPGVGPKVCEKLQRLDIYRIDHLLLHLPKSYEDRTRTVPLDQLRPNERCQVEGIVKEARVEYFQGASSAGVAGR